MQQKIITIQRADHGKDNPYFMMSRATAQDNGISYEAAGMLAYLLSKPDDWKVQPHDLQRPACGKNKVYKLLKELIAARYIKRDEVRDEQGRIAEWRYDVYEHPYPLPTYQEVDIPELGLQELENGDITYKRPYIKEKEHKTDIHHHTPPAPIDLPDPTPTPHDDDDLPHTGELDQSELEENKRTLAAAGITNPNRDRLAAAYTAQQIANVLTAATANGWGPGLIVIELRTNANGTRDHNPPQSGEIADFSAIEQREVQTTNRYLSALTVREDNPFERPEPIEQISPESDPDAAPEILTGQAVA